jgi:hypothetical protein
MISNSGLCVGKTRETVAFVVRSSSFFSIRGIFAVLYLLYPIILVLQFYERIV